MAAFPSYLATYEELVSSRGDQLSAATVFADLACETDQMLLGLRDGDKIRLEEVFTALERVVSDPQVDAAQVISVFFSTLSPTARLRADTYLHPRSARLADDQGHSGETEEDSGVSRAAPPQFRSRPRRYSGRAPRRRRRL